MKKLTVTDANFDEEGKWIIQKGSGSKVIKIIDLKAFYKFLDNKYPNRKQKFTASEQFPYQLQMLGLIKECKSLKDCIDSYNKAIDDYNL